MRIEKNIVKLLVFENLFEINKEKIDNKKGR